MKKKTFKKNQLLHLRSIETTPSTEYSLMPGMIWNLTRYHHAHMHAHTSKHAHTRLCENKMPSVPHVFEINLSLGGFLLSWSGLEGTDFHRLNRFPWTFVWTTFNAGYMVSFFSIQPYFNICTTHAYYNLQCKLFKFHNSLNLIFLVLVFDSFRKTSQAFPYHHIKPSSIIHTTQGWFIPYSGKKYISQDLSVSVQPMNPVSINENVADRVISHWRCNIFNRVGKISLVYRHQWLGFFLLKFAYNDIPVTILSDAFGILIQRLTMRVELHGFPGAQYR